MASVCPSTGHLLDHSTLGSPSHRSSELLLLAPAPPEPGAGVQCFGEFCTRAEKEKLLAAAAESALPAQLPIWSLLHNQMDRIYNCSEVRFFAAPLEKPVFFFAFERHDKTYPILQFSSAVWPLDACLFKAALCAFLAHVSRALASVREFLVSAEDGLLHLFTDVQREMLGGRFASRLAGSRDMSCFYASDSQMELAKQEKLEVPAGYVLDDLHECDALLVHGAWRNARDLQCTRDRIRHLPSACLRDVSSGVAASWAFASNFGQLTAHFTEPSHRRRGLAAAVELAMMKQFMRMGQRPFKYVASDNVAVLRSSLASPFYTLWRRDGEPVVYHFQFFSAADDS